MNDDLTKIPKDLPRPEIDGACDHLLGITIPSIILPSTMGDSLDICKIDTCFVILYFFPMMANPEKSLPLGWNDIPGARGCTPQNITMNEHYDDLLKFDATPIGISTQKIEELSKLSSVRGFSQIILSDKSLNLKEKLNIPTFQIDDETFYKRLTLIVKDSKIIKVFYPVFPPDKHVWEVLKWLKNNSDFSNVNS